MEDMAAPTLPMISSEITQAFYEGLGFVCGHRAQEPDQYLILIRHGVHLHFYTEPRLDPGLNNSGCFIYTRKIQALYDAFSVQKGGRITPVKTTPWGTLQFDLHDPNGNLVRVAQGTWTI